MQEFGLASDPRSPSEASPTLVVSGLLMIAAGLMLANPHFGVTDARWPWDILRQDPTRLVSVNWMLWFTTALLAVALGLTNSRRWRAPILGAMALTLAFTCHSQQAGLRIEDNHLVWFAAATALAAGFLLGADDRHPATARTYTVLGGLGLLWALAASFKQSETGRAGSALVVLVEDLGQRLTGQTVPDAPGTYDQTLWAYGCLLVAAALGILALIGVRGPLMSRMGFLLVLLHFLIPTFSTLGSELSTSFSWPTVVARVTGVLIHTGLALWLLWAGTLVDLARLGSSDAPATAGESRS